MKSLLVKKRKHLCGVIAVCILMFVGCDSVINAEKAEPSDIKNSMLSEQSAKGGKWIHNVTGGGEDFYPGEEDEATFEITFNARMDTDGNVKGKVKWNYLDGTPASYGNVQCLEVQDNRAYISYIAEGGEAGGYGTPGNTVFLAFEDNGEGANAPVDRHTFIYPVGPTDNCDLFQDYVVYFNIEGFPVEWVNGNVQVR